MSADKYFQTCGYSCTTNFRRKDGQLQSGSEAFYLWETGTKIFSSPSQFMSSCSPFLMILGFCAKYDPQKMPCKVRFFTKAMLAATCKYLNVSSCRKSFSLRPLHPSKVRSVGARDLEQQGSLLSSKGLPFISSGRIGANIFSLGFVRGF